MIDIFIRCVPPQVTAQQKRVARTPKGLRFFKPERLAREETTWAALLRPHVPDVPMDGPLAIRIRMVYPHRASTPKRDRDKLLPKTTKPDGANASKHLEDTLTRMRFVVDDALFVDTRIQKLFGPEAAVGIGIRIVPFDLSQMGA